MRLVDNLHAYLWRGEDNNCNSYLFAGVLANGRHVLVDPGHVTTPSFQEPGWNRLVQEMREDGLDAAEIGLVVLTHAHGDHCEAAALARQSCRALVATSEVEARMYERMGGAVDVYLEEGELLLGQNGEMRLEVFHSPGHSPGHVTLYWPEKKVLITGDVIFHMSTGRVDLPGGSASALKQSINRLSELDVEYMLSGHPYYGHPGVIEGKAAVEQNFTYVKKAFFR